MGSRLFTLETETEKTEVGSLLSKFSYLKNRMITYRCTVKTECASKLALILNMYSGFPMPKWRHSTTYANLDLRWIKPVLFVARDTLIY